MEKDANFLKKPIHEYLERAAEAVLSNKDELEELRLILNRVSQDRAVLASLEARLNEKINFLMNVKTKDTEINTLLENAKRERR